MFRGKRKTITCVLVSVFIFASVTLMWQVYDNPGHFLKTDKLLDNAGSYFRIGAPSLVQKENEQLQSQLQSLHPDVKVVSSSPPTGLVLPYKDCVPLPNSPRTGVQICLHPVIDDRYVSGALKRGELWESSLIYDMKNALQKDSNLQLVDLGCNIGEYTLFAAAMGRQVLAVEMLETNIHLVQTSLQLSNLSSLVTLVNNAMYKDHRQLKTTFLDGNMGGSRLNDSAVINPEVRINDQKRSVTVNTVCIDDLIPLVKNKTVYLKIDIENSEHHALACAHKFFSQLDVRYVQMEWLDRSADEISQIKQFMSKYGYLPSSSIHTFKPVDINVHTIEGHDVYFVKQSSTNVS